MSSAIPTVPPDPRADHPRPAGPDLATTPRTPPAAANPFAAHRCAVLDSFIAYADHGDGPCVVYLHGNPTSSRIWRDVIAHVPGRAIAPDLIGMGASGRPDIAYRFVDHARYLDAFLDALALRDPILVGYDWGGTLALDWAARHPGRARGVAVFETFLRPMRWSDWPPAGEALFRAYRTPGEGEAMVLERNEFLTRSLAHGVQRGLSADEHAAYLAPFPDPVSRRPVLAWPRELPIDGAPADVVARIEGFGRALAEDRTPLLLLTFAGSGLSAPPLVAWARAQFPALEVAALEAAGHHAPEDRPADIGHAIAGWVARLAR